MVERPEESRDYAQVISAVVLVGGILFIAIFLFGALAEVATPIGADSEEFEPVTDENSYTVSTGDVDSVEVLASREYAADIQTFDGYVDAELPIDTAEDFAIAIAANLTDDAPLDGAAYELVGIDNGEVALWLDGGEWFASVNTTTGTEHARVSAESPYDYSTVSLQYNATSDELNLTADGASSTSTTDTTRNASVSWQGQLDEWRAWDELDTSTIDDYHDDPIAASDTEPVARVAFHEGSGDSAKIYYYPDSEQATLVNSGWGQGVLAPELVRGQDYELSQNGDDVSIVPLTDGYIDGQPVAFVSAAGGTLSDGLGAVVSGVGSAVELAALIAILILIGPLLMRLRTMGEERR